VVFIFYVLYAYNTKPYLYLTHVCILFDFIDIQQWVDFFEIEKSDEFFTTSVPWVYYINEPVQCTCVYTLRIHIVGRGRGTAFFRVVYSVYTEGIRPTVIWVPTTFTMHFLDF